MRLTGASGELHQVLAAELLDRIAWFVRLRWAAGAALLAFAAAAPRAGMPSERAGVWLVAVVVLAYNAICTRCSRRGAAAARPTTAGWRAAP